MAIPLTYIARNLTTRKLTTALTAGDWIRCTAVASSVLWLSEASKLVTRIGRSATRREAPRA